MLCRGSERRDRLPLGRWSIRTAAGACDLSRASASGRHCYHRRRGVRTRGKAATASIPIVFVAGTDPVAIGLVTNLNRPGGNITGISALLSEQMAKRLGLLKELVPKAPLIGVLVNPSYSD